MTIQQLEYILDIQRTGSFAKTAKNFFVTPSSVSNSISTLEEELGFAVFTRDWRGAVPTEKGGAVLRHAAQVCKHTQAIAAQGEPEAKELRMDTFVHPLFQTAFTRLAAECAHRDGIRLSLRNGSADRSLEQVARSKVGLFATFVMYNKREGLIGSRNLRVIKRLASDFGLEVDVHGTVPLVVRIGPGHRLYRQEEISLDEFRDDVMIDTPNLDMAETVHSALGVYPERTLTAAEVITRRELVAQGQGYDCGYKYAKRLDEQYGFRNIAVPWGEGSLVTVCKPGELRPEFQRYIRLLNEELEAINAN